MQNVPSKKAVLIIAHKNFRDEELFEPKSVLEKNGIDVVVASSSLDTATGMLGARVDPDIRIDDIKVEDFDGVVFIGGSGAREYWDSPTAHAIARKAMESGKVLGAICLAPVTLANAGLLSGKRSTVFNSEIETIKSKGAIYTGKGVEIDGDIITGEGPGAAREFGEAVAGSILEK